MLAGLRRSDSPSDARVCAARGHIAANMLLLRRGAGVVTGPAAGPQLSQLLHRRWLNVHEYQGAQLLRDAGVRVPPGVACHTPEEVAAAARQLGGPDGEVVLKSQVLAGGRGLGTFTNGLKGGVHIVKVCVQYTSRLFLNASTRRGMGSVGRPNQPRCVPSASPLPGC